MLLSLLWPAILSYGHGAATDYEDAVVTMYIAYYGRPGDPDGVDFWAEKLEQAEGDLRALPREATLPRGQRGSRGATPRETFL